MLELTAAVDALGHALEAGDIGRAVDVFQDDCYWRDLIAFTWNITTLEGKDAVRAMLEVQLAGIDTSNWALDPAVPASADGEVTTGSFTFETGAVRGYGMIRVKGGKIWTLLTTAAELKGHEGHLGFQRPLGAKHGSGKHRPTWKEEIEQERQTLGHTVQPYVVIVGGGQGGIALGARLRVLGVPAIIVERMRGPAIAGAIATSRSACTTRSGTTTCPISRSRRTGRCFRPRTRSVIGWKCTRRSWS